MNSYTHFVLHRHHSLLLEALSTPLHCTHITVDRISYWKLLTTPPTPAPPGGRSTGGASCTFCMVAAPHNPRRCPPPFAFFLFHLVSPSSKDSLYFSSHRLRLSNGYYGSIGTVLPPIEPSWIISSSCLTNNLPDPRGTHQLEKRPTPEPHHSPQPEGTSTQPLEPLTASRDLSLRQKPYSRGLQPHREVLRLQHTSPSLDLPTEPPARELRRSYTCRSCRPQRRPEPLTPLLRLLPPTPLLRPKPRTPLLHLAPPTPLLHSEPLTPLHHSEALTPLPLSAWNRLCPSSARSRVRPLSAWRHLCPLSARSRLRPSSAWNHLLPLCSEPPCASSAWIHLRPSSSRSRLRPSSAWNHLHPSSARSRLHPFSAWDYLRPFSRGPATHCTPRQHPPCRTGVHLPAPTAPTPFYPDRRPLAPISAKRTTPPSSPTVPCSRYDPCHTTVGTSPCATFYPAQELPIVATPEAHNTHTWTVND